jgi:hypothetical protein
VRRSDPHPQTQTAAASGWQPAAVGQCAWALSGWRAWSRRTRTVAAAARRYRTAYRRPPSSQCGAPQGADEEEVARLEQALTYVLGAAMSAGAVLWANRSLGLLAPVAMSMPAWKGIDPLPAVAPEDVADEYPADHQDILDQAAESMVFRSARGGGLPA